MILRCRASGCSSSARPTLAQLASPGAIFYGVSIATPRPSALLETHLPISPTARGGFSQRRATRILNTLGSQRGQFLMGPLDLVKLTALMDRTSGSPEVKIGLIDGPVVTRHPDLAGEHLREIPGNNGGTCTQANSTACLHGTFVAGILSAKRTSPAPAICPNCTLLIRPIFAETTAGSEQMPSAT